MSINSRHSSFQRMMNGSVMLIGFLISMVSEVMRFGTCFQTSILDLHETRHPYFACNRQRRLQPNQWILDVKSRTLSLSQSSNSNNRNSFQPNFLSNDPWAILGLSPSVTDAKEIKRAYKRLALKYHPDMVTTKDSTAEAKKAASDQFSKINWAYETLMNGNKNVKQTTTSSSSSQRSTGKTNANKEEWVPPHRRTTSYYGSTTSSSSKIDDVDPFDSYIPQYDSVFDTNYDAGGDSFGKIFADLIASAAGATASRNSIFSDFVEFLEKNIEGYNSIDNDPSIDRDLKTLLQTGSIDEVVEELDETELVILQLSKKRQSIENDLISIQAELKLATAYREKMEFQEQIEELQARSKIVESYLIRAKDRLLKLQLRYKDLIVRGEDPSRTTRRTTGTTWDDIKRETSSWSSSTSSNDSNGDYTYKNNVNSGPGRDSGPSSTSASGSTDTDDSWQTESFGSFGRGRGSSNRKRSRSSPSDSPHRTSASGNSNSDFSKGSNPSYTSATSQPTKNNYANTREQRPGDPTSNGRNSATKSTSTDVFVPPHRRVTSSMFDDVSNKYDRKEADKRRLREIKVDEEFDKLKKELGLK